MATINSRAQVDEIIAADGICYPGEPRVIKIVRYNNQFDGAEAFGLVFEGEGGYDRYEQSPACHNPVVIFEAS